MRCSHGTTRLQRAHTSPIIFIFLLAGSCIAFPDNQTNYDTGTANDPLFIHYLLKRHSSLMLSWICKNRTPQINCVHKW